MPERNDPTIPAKPIIQFQQPRKPGRPTKASLPPLPKYPMEPEEQAIFDAFVKGYNEEYPDLTDTDQLILHLAAAEYVKCLRVLQEEFDTNKILSQARQHPSVQLRAYLDQLSVTRKQRDKKPAGTDEEKNQAESFLMGLSQKGKKDA